MSFIDQLLVGLEGKMLSDGELHGGGDKRTHWRQHFVYGESGSAEKQHHYPHHLLTCCL